MTLTDGVFASNAATASLNSTITCGRSSAPLCVLDMNRLAGKVPDSTAVSVFSIRPVAAPFCGWMPPPPVGFSSRTSNVSPSSSMSSSFTVTSNSFDFSPGANVSVPLAATQSIPALAVPSTVR